MSTLMAERRQRLAVEVLSDEEPLVRQVRAAAALRGIALREWVMEALREKLERERTAVT